MSQPKQQPKVLTHKPKKSQRAPSGAGKGVSAPSKAPLPNPPPPPNESTWNRFRIVLPTLLILNAVLVGYAIVRTSIKPSDLSFQTSELSKEADSLEHEEKEEEEKPKEADNERAEVVDRNKGPLELPESEASEVVDRNKGPLEFLESEASEESKSKVEESPNVALAIAHPPQPNLQVNSRPKPSNEEQQELFKWMLTEKRKLKPVTKAEKAQIDAEKALLKDFLRRKGVVDF